MNEPRRYPQCDSMFGHTVASVAHRILVNIEVEAIQAVDGERTFGVPLTSSSIFMESAADQFAQLPGLQDCLMAAFPCLHANKAEIFVSRLAFKLKDRDPSEWIRRIAREEIAASRDAPSAEASTQMSELIAAYPAAERISSILFQSPRGSGSAPRFLQRVRSMFARALQPFGARP